VSTTTSPPTAAALPIVPRAATTRLRPHALYVDLAVHRDYSSPAARALRQPRRAPRVLVSTPPTAAIYLDYAARPGASARRAARHAARRAARRRLLRLVQARRRLIHRASGCLGTSRGSSRGSSRRSSSTTSPRPGSSSTTPPRVWVPRHVARLVTRLVAPLIVDYFAYAARPGASARRAARRVARCAARRRLLRLCRASGCLGTSRVPSHGSSSTTPPHVRVPRHVARLVMPLVAPLIVDYFAYAARPGASARRAARHMAHRRLLRAPRLRLAATLALLQPRCAW
jgi:hypothetical protein